MIQDSVRGKYSCEYKKTEVKPESKVLCFWDGRIIIQKEDPVALPYYKDLLPGGENSMERFQFLFAIDEMDYFLAPIGEQYEIDGFSYEDVRGVRDYAPLEICFVISTGYQLFNWYRDNRFCGRCGKILHTGARERMLWCKACGNAIYPKIAPAVITAVTNGDKLLVTKYSGRLYQRYALVAGFCEIGETAEDTVHREVMEETGLRVKNLRYYKSQPWGFDNNLLLGYFAELNGSDTIIRDEEELAEAKWINRSELQEVDDGISLTREMMARSFLDS